MSFRSISWYSTRESRDAGKLSVLAVAETVLSVAAYWGIAIYFETYIHLVASILILSSATHVREYIINEDGSLSRNRPIAGGQGGHQCPPAGFGVGDPKKS